MGHLGPASAVLTITAATTNPAAPAIADDTESEGESIASSPPWLTETLTDDEASGGAVGSSQVWSYHTHHTSIRPTPI